MAQSNIPLPMMGAFTFDGKSSLDFGLVCKTVMRPALSPVKFRRIEYGTRSGAYDFPSTNHELRSVSTKVQFIGNYREEKNTPEGVLQNIINPNHLIRSDIPQSFYELRSRIHELAGWLYKSDWKALQFYDDPLRYFLAKIDGEISVGEVEQMALGGAEINWVCQPMMLGEQIIYNQSGSGNLNIDNPGTSTIGSNSQLGSLFSIVVSGSTGITTLNLNGRSLTITNPGSYILINNIICEANNGGTSNLFQTLTGSIDKFLELIPGRNTMEISTNGYISINFIPMWL